MKILVEYRVKKGAISMNRITKLKQSLLKRKIKEIA